ncbi:unnamed protein product [Larinioides sclopetarius]|uniref:Cation/H+ exchanger transmembrane domain-containing protein n=1 Tax=Larinioides sclopetarius TaxID=280406 RepID=A0AAV1YPZ0_9ARAC
MIVGIIYGVLLGVIAWYIPNPNENRVSVFRFLILCLGGTFVLFVSQALKWGPVGALGCICLPFVAAIRWKKEGINPVEGALTFVWMVIEPFLFGLIGSEIRIEYLKPNIVGLGLTTLLFNVAARMLAAFVSAFSAGLTLKEQIFVTIAGLPKATVQAAVGPVALSLARKQQLGAEAEEFGITILTTAVLSILVAAPLGATSLALLAPRLLEKDANSSDQEKQKPSNTDDDKLQSITNETENRNKIQSTEKE